jgi:hypothetical protein
MNKSSRAALLAFGLAFSAPVLAADLPSIKDAPLLAPAPNDWRFEATLNGWMPSLMVNTGYGWLLDASRPSLRQRAPEHHGPER